MPVTFEFDDGIVVLRMAGEYLLVEVRIALTAALDDAEPRPVYGLLLDLTQSESISTRTLGDVTSIIGFLTYHAPSFGRRIALVGSSDVTYGVLRMADVDLDTGGVEANVFRNAAEGLRWLKESRSKGASKYLPDSQDPPAP
jgi:hypothetical protein